MRPICANCKVFMRPKKNGIGFLEMMKIPIGKGMASSVHKPYRVWIGDLWHCLSCGAQIISGVCSNRIAEHYEHNFQKTIDNYGANKFQIREPWE